MTGHCADRVEMGQGRRNRAQLRNVAGLAKAAIHVYQDGETGVSWAATIQNEQLRARMVDHTLGQWLQHDPEAARAWATKHKVPIPQGRSGRK